MSLKTRFLLVLSCVALLGVGFAAGKYEAPLRTWLAGLSSPSQLKEPAPVVTPPIATAPAAEEAERPAANIDYSTLKTLRDLDQGQEAFITGLRRNIKVAVGAQAEDLHQQALAAAQQGDLAQAVDHAEEAVALGDATLWLPLAGWKRQNQSTDEALRLAWQAVRDAREKPEQAAAYRLVGDLLSESAQSALALAAWQKAQELAPDAATRRKIDLATGKLFAVLRLDVQAEQDTPEVCAVFPVDLVTDGSVDYRSYVAVTPERKLAVFPHGKTLCLSGLTHGERYQLVFRAGLPAAGGGRLEQDHQEQVTLTARPPFLAFPDKTYILESVN